MKGRVDVWPSLTDLFSALLLGTFGALMLSVKPPPPPKRPCVDIEAEKIRKGILASLLKHLPGTVREFADDVYIDVYLNFELNEDEILAEDRQKLARACAALRELFEENPQWRQEVEIWIEGHTDGTVPREAATRRDRDLYNWRLSGNRAASVLYEFSQCGVTPLSHPVRAIGYADTQPLPQCAGKQQCRDNRRTTFRIRPDKAAIAKRPELKTATICEPPH